MRFMSVLRYFTLFLLVLTVFASPARAQSPSDEIVQCREAKPEVTNVTVRVIAKPPEFQFDKTKVDLIRYDKEIYKDWLKSNSIYELWWENDLVSEYIFTGWAVHTDMKIRPKTVDNFSIFHCAYFNEVTVNIYYQTLTFIPKEYPEGSCEFEVAHEHALAHHAVNVDTITEHAGMLENDLVYIVNTLEGPAFPREHMEHTFAVMKQGMNEAIHVYITDTVYRKIMRQHEDLDSIQKEAEKSLMLRNCAETGDAYTSKADLEAMQKQEEQKEPPAQ